MFTLQSTRPEIKGVVRVSVSNNFNCSDAEYAQLGKFVADHPNRYFFVNCNINTPLLKNINKHPYKVVVTINPNLKIPTTAISKLSKIDKEKVAFVRVKYLPNQPSIKECIKLLSDLGYIVLITAQRFNGKESLRKYTSLEYYKFDCSRYRQSHEHFSQMCEYADSLPNTYVCDRSGKGCQGCGMCSTLTLGKEVPLYTLHLSSSGLCKFNCPDCYAKAMQRFLKGCGLPLIKFDVIRKNSKQLGRTVHIKRVLSKEVA